MFEVKLSTLTQLLYLKIEAPQSFQNSVNVYYPTRRNIRFHYVDVVQGLDNTLQRRIYLIKKTYINAYNQIYRVFERNLICIATSSYFLNTIVKKEGEDQSDRLKNEVVLQRVKKEKKHPTLNKIKEC
jgi:hypothetical protein